VVERLKVFPPRHVALRPAAATPRSADAHFAVAQAEGAAGDKTDGAGREVTVRELSFAAPVPGPGGELREAGAGQPLARTLVALEISREGAVAQQAVGWK